MVIEVGSFSGTEKWCVRDVVVACSTAKMGGSKQFMFQLHYLEFSGFELIACAMVIAISKNP